MNLESELLRENSRRQADRVVAWVGGDRRRLKELMRVFLTGERVPAQRAAHAVGIFWEKHPEMITPYLGRMFARMQEEGIHDAVRRCVVRGLQCVEIPPGMLGPLANACFEYLSAVETPVAIRCLSMTVLARIAEKEPDLWGELRLVIDQHLPYAGAAFRARAKQVLKASIHISDGRLKNQ
jgi:hypothetical protein